MDVSSEVSRLLGVSPDGVVELEDETFGVSGFLSYRRRGSLRRDGESERVRVFVKCSDTSRCELKQAQQFSHKACRNECVFYSVMCPILDRARSRCRLLPPACPRVFGEQVTDTRTLLVMEDLTESGFTGADRKLLTLEEAECVVKTMAGLQATFWLARTSVDYAADDAIFGRNSPFHESKKPNQNPIIEFSLNFFNEHFSSFASCKEDEQVILDSLPSLRSAAASSDRDSDPSRPLGIVHGDLWFSNFVFRNSGDSLECRIFDWQFWSLGLFGCDIGQLALTCLPTEVLKTQLNRLVTLHYETFKTTFEAASGQEVPFSEDESKRNLSDALLRGFLWNVVAFTTAFNKDVFATAHVISNIAFVLKSGLVEFPSA